MYRILFPTDFSVAAENAFDYALNMAKAINAKIDLMYVYDVSFSDASAIPYDFLQQQTNEKVEWANKQFDLFLDGKNKELIGEKIPYYGVFTAIEIVDFAKANKYDYIVMGTKGKKNRLEKLVGSITSSVIMKSHCPVIAIPSDAKYPVIKKIAYASTFEASDKHSVEQLMKFAGKLGASVHFVNVNSKTNEESFETIEKIDNYPIPFTDFTVVNNYSVMNGLEGFIKDRGIDMLALYIPNRRLWERIFHQSFTKRMALHSHIPLIVFHE